ncbi:cinnamyl-alcohol dehydrogenase [Aspergillus steynii IBT 23096]|uniref:Cinnamyl-alcohol dehydrogenase n=1 Tax=Aspergillus steynii IBT 23096 TaxID=1392250 RepID=A0A2I2GDJ4_9EURO|nr:cinnamyl-alcohol dehydrogenase [Aspergillus steynii IBT 23096]PLB50943.1 cinnamyl-alcohol dehydrogenase [Aspergillus steynii IBT 23096]
MPPLVLLTGATGYIGSRVLLEALRSGYHVRISARTPEKAQKVLSNPVIQSLSPGARLTSVVIPDITAQGAFDDALQDITYVIHVGSPVPVPSYDPMTDIYQPTVQGTSNLLSSALKHPSIKRILITSSIVANMTPIPDPNVRVSAASRVPIPPPTSLSSVFEGYILGKINEINNTDAFVASHSPHFSVAHVIPGYVYGPNVLYPGDNDALVKNSSNGLLIASVTGVAVPVPVHEGFVHIADLADIHLKALEYEPREGGPRAFGACNFADYAATFDIVAKAYPKATAEGVFSKGSMPTLPAPYDSSETERELGVRFRSFEEAVVDAAGQFLENLGRERV